MGVQQHRHSKSRVRRSRAAVMKMEAPNYSECPKCHEAKMPHRLCPSCGYYNEKITIAPATKEE